MPKLFVFHVIVFFAVAGALAQNSKISGIVFDPAGAGIESAYVLIHTDALDREHRTPYRLELRTSKQGQFTATLPPGFFDVFIAAEGFTPYSQKLRTHPGVPQQIRASLKLDPLFMNEYGDKFFETPAEVETKTSSVPHLLEDTPH